MANNKSITESLVQLRDDLKEWTINNLNTKSPTSHTHNVYDEAIYDLNQEVAIDYSQIAFDTGSEYEDAGIDFSVYQTKADGTLSTTAKTVSGAINELDAGIDNETSLRTEADTVLDNKIAQISNPNLLINSDFRNPINQRGQTSYTYPSQGQQKMYTIDRWYLSPRPGETLTVNDGCITLTAGSSASVTAIYQRFEKLEFGTYTLTTKINGKVYSVTLNCNGEYVDKTWDDGVFIFYSYGDSVNTFGIGAVASLMSSMDIEWAKLEQGSIATPFVPRPIGEEIALCQRYYISCKVDCFPGYGFVNYLITDAIITVPTPVTMRTTPTLNLVTYGCLYGQGTTHTFTLANVSNIHSYDHGIVTGLQKNQGVTCAFVGGYSLDAEIY